MIYSCIKKLINVNFIRKYFRGGGGKLRQYLAHYFRRNFRIQAVDCGRRIDLRLFS